MNAYISTDLNAIKALDPERHRIALAREEFLSKGGTIYVLEGPRMEPLPPRHEPPPSIKAKPERREAAEQPYIDSITQRDMDREERVAQRAKDKAAQITLIRKLAETMCYSQAMMCTGLPLRSLQRIAKQGDFKFQPAVNNGRSNLIPKVIDEAKDAKDSERIKAFMEIGLSRNQAIAQLGTTFKTFTRLLTKFDIDYPKRKAGPNPTFFAKQQ